MSPIVEDPDDSSSLESRVNRNKRRQSVNSAAKRRRRTVDEKPETTGCDSQLTSQRREKQAAAQADLSDDAARKSAVSTASSLDRSESSKQSVVSPVSDTPTKMALIPRPLLPRVVGGRQRATGESSIAKTPKAGVVQIDSLSEGIHRSTLRVKVLSKSRVRKSVA